MLCTAWMTTQCGGWLNSHWCDKRWIEWHTPGLYHPVNHENRSIPETVMLIPATYWYCKINTKWLSDVNKCDVPVSISNTVWRSQRQIPLFLGCSQQRWILQAPVRTQSHLIRLWVPESLSEILQVIVFSLLCCINWNTPTPPPPCKKSKQKNELSRKQN